MGHWMFKGMARAYRQRLPSVKRYFAFLFLVSVAFGVCFIVYVSVEHSLSPHDATSVLKFQPHKEPSFLQKIKAAVKAQGEQPANVAPTKVPSQLHKSSSKDLHRGLAMAFSPTNSTQNKPQSSSMDNTSVNYNVHIFYYPWYGNPQTDGQYLHWNHRMLPHWKAEVAKKYPQDVHVPPDDIGSNFYPQLGPYSSADPATVNTHMAWIRSTGAGVLVVSWYPPDQADENGQPFDKLLPLILDAAHSHGLKVCIHIEPYKDRNAETLNRHVRYIIDSYGRHPAFYRTQVGQTSLPVFYVYDSYQILSSVWAHALKPGGPLSLRGTEYDGIFLALYLSEEDKHKIVHAGFDGFYTYFAADGFTKGSTRNNWKKIAQFANKEGLLFVPSIGPGYVDTRVRPWNGENTRKRVHGKYFKESFQAAVEAGVKYISVTSFNEWHEGTQIEPAIPKQIKGFTYEDYTPDGPDYYLQLLKSFVEKFSKRD